MTCLAFQNLWQQKFRLALSVGLSQFMHMVAPEGFLKKWAGRFFGLLFFVAILPGFWLLIGVMLPTRRH